MQLTGRIVCRCGAVVLNTKAPKHHEAYDRELLESDNIHIMALSNISQTDPKLLGGGVLLVHVRLARFCP